MFLNNGVSINTGKKRKEVSPDATMLPQTTTDYNSLQHVSAALRRVRQPSPLTPPPQDTNLLPLLSFTSLLNEDRTAEIVEQSDQIDEIIRTHAEQLQRALADKWQGHYRTLQCAAEERAAKRLKEREGEMEKMVRRNAELEQMAARYSAEAEVWRTEAKRLENTVGTLRASLLKATVRGGLGCGGSAGVAAAEDAESSYVDPDRVEPVSLACKGCGKRVATVMMWPCRHMCVCKGCDIVSKTCLVCRSIKTTSIEVVLS
ncbi:BOI-related E3 ubiquitin-protein ligase 1-like [Rhododendron vialii]|uniref:BOI-related E3 ubiquitin-protein ligase 1-like n=1 Tax=Rhododendron vialii TaxID=182163 RepID=UPI00265E02E0|nr:BOI-related E3 ubiquitin-protein ligase 1-like [Rhododendron vialii]